MKTQFLPTVMLAALAVSIGISTTAKADWEDRIRLSGFGSAAYQITDQQASFNGAANEEGINRDGSFQETKLGLNINTAVTDRLTVAGQLLGEASENYDVHVDWAFAAFRLNEQFTFRAGKLKYPVGLVNEYRDVGYAYPWLTTPYVIYSELATKSSMNTTVTSPDVTREAYTGVSGLWNLDLGDWSLGTNLFGGYVNLESATVKKLLGLTLNLDWDDTILFTASAYNGEMQNVPDFTIDETNGTTITNPMATMNGKDHTVVLVGVKVDWNNVILYAEASRVNMEGIAAMTSQEWYATLGYRIGKWLPHLTHQEFENDADKAGTQYTKYQINSLGLRYELMKNTALKVDISQIDHQTGNGLFNGVIEGNNDIIKYGLGIDYIF